MRSVHDSVLYCHIALGFLALTSFWVPALTAKGGKTHRRVGWVYVAAMLGVVITAMILATLLFLAPQEVRDFSNARPEDVADGVVRLRGVALFFAALALLTFTGGWHGLRVLHAKRNPAAMRTPFNITLHVLNVAIAVPLWVLCFRHGEPLYGFFGTLCLASGTSDLWRLWRLSHDPRYWLYEHLSSMIGTGIAAHTAFLAFGAVRLVPAFYSLSPALYVIPWIAPTVIGVMAIAWLQRHYRKTSATMIRSEAEPDSDSLPVSRVVG
jgi:hypothetical protein